MEEVDYVPERQIWGLSAPQTSVVCLNFIDAKLTKARSAVFISEKQGQEVLTWAVTEKSFHTSVLS